MTVLDEIIAGVRSRLAQREALTPLNDVKRLAEEAPSAKDVVGALRDGSAPVSVIAEIKRSSP